MAKQLSFEEFSARVEKAYNGRISVVKETYVNTKHQITAYCNVHKIYFKVIARHLERGKANCPECSKIKRQNANQSKVISFSEMLKRFREAYGDKFSYDESSYHGRKELMKVHCNDCGENFEISPVHHLKYNNGGCPNCHKYKNVKCSICGKDIVVNSHSDVTHVYCDECRKYVKLATSQNTKTKNIIKTSKEIYIKCVFCGSIYKYGERCKNSLCNEHHSIKWYQNLIPFGFDYSKIGTIDYIDEYYKSMCVILIEYYDNMLSPKQIYEKYNCSKYIKSDVTIKNLIISAGFKVRNRSEAV